MRGFLLTAAANANRIFAERGPPRITALIMGLGGLARRMWWVMSIRRIGIMQGARPGSSTCREKVCHLDWRNVTVVGSMKSPAAQIGTGSRAYALALTAAMSWRRK